MKKSYALFVIILLLGVFLFFFSQKKKSDYSEFKIITYQLEGKSRQLLVADTKEKWERGLMNYRNLPSVDGMIFLFPQKEYRSFWNQGTYLTLDLYWLNDSQVVGKSSLPSIEKTHKPIIVNSPREVNTVVELVHY
jgi:uncharacterized membrane protein (UPF0127 family)